MNTVSKQDGVCPRTPSALEQKYNYGKVFEEITGIQLTVEEQEAMMRAELSLKLGYDDNDQIVSMLNASANIITIKGNRLTIESDHFDLDADGTIHATAGVIGGCSIVNGVLKVPTANITGKLTADQIDTGSFTAKLEEIEDDVGTLQTNFTVLSGQIESKVSQTEFDTLSGTVSTHETRITQLPDQILSEVSATYATQDALDKGITSAESKITQTASEIRSECAATYATQEQIFGVADFEARLIRAESSITQMPDEILSTVSGTYATKDSLDDYAKLSETEGLNKRLLTAESNISQMPNQIMTSVSATYATQESLDNYATKESLNGYATTAQLTAAEAKITQTSTEILAEVSGTYVTKDNASTSYATKDELSEVSGQLELKIDVNDNNQIVSMLNVATDEIHIKTELFHLDGERTYIRDGEMAMEYIEAYDVLLGDRGQYLRINSDGVQLTGSGGYYAEEPVLTMVANYDSNIDKEIPIITADRIKINSAVIISDSVQIYGKWTISANSLDYYNDASTYFSITVGGITGSATGGKLLSWSKLYELVNS